jgi:maltose/moltooligosaccharide transporter
MIGVGFAWSSILSVPYSILSGALPARKMGVYMGIFNFFIVIPQLLAATVLGAAAQDLLRRGGDLGPGAGRGLAVRRRPLRVRRQRSGRAQGPGQDLRTSVRTSPSS